MDPYALQGEQYILEPLDFETVEEIYPVIALDEVKKQSLAYANFNVSVSINYIINKIEEEYDDNNVYTIKRAADRSVVGVIGLIDIDWQQSRGTLVLLMEQKAIKARECYEPVKLILKNATSMLHMRKILFQTYKDDASLEALLKGFGFEQEGTVTNYVLFEGEEHDIVQFSLDKKKFRFVE